MKSKRKFQCFSNIDRKSKVSLGNSRFSLKEPGYEYYRAHLLLVLMPHPTKIKLKKKEKEKRLKIDKNR